MGSENEAVRVTQPTDWEAGLPAGTVAVTEAEPGCLSMDLTHRVVTMAALDLWLREFGAQTYPDTESRAQAVADWLGTQHQQPQSVSYIQWCKATVKRLRAMGIDASLYSLTGSDRVAVVRK